MFGLLDYFKIGGGFVLGAALSWAVAYPAAYYRGENAGRATEQAAARTRALDLIQKRSEDNAEISAMDLAGACAELGGRWVPDEDRCD
jgi:hypothetical protein